jgi:hypothetical protein
MEREVAEAVQLMVALYPPTGHDHEHVWSCLELYYSPINPDKD